MIYRTKIYLYDSAQEANGYRGLDLSANVMLGDQITENITQELDTAEITLLGLTRRERFAPTTKFIVDLVAIDGENEEIVNTRHFVVNMDTVSKPVLADDEYYDHHISLIEPSVIAQKRIVDNISTTYKIKDVTLQQVPAYPSENPFCNIEQKEEFEFKINFGKTISSGGRVTRWAWGKYFDLEGELQLQNMQGIAFNQVYNNVSNFLTDDNTYKARFALPKFAIYAGVENSVMFTKIGYASIDYVIKEYDTTNLANPTREVKGSIISNSNLSLGDGYIPDIPTPIGSYGKIRGSEEWLAENAMRPAISTFHIGVKKYTDITAPTPSYFTEYFEIFPDKTYIVELSLHEFEDDYPYESTPTVTVRKSLIEDVVYYAYGGYNENTMNSIAENTFLTPQEKSTQTTYTFYDVDTSGDIVFASSVPYSAQALIQKAIINSALYSKQPNVYIADTNRASLPFYIDANFLGELSTTAIIENFYNQKNLWEVLIEAGYYIHAIPELTFGDDDKFKITFNRLGRTDQKTDNGTKVSIFNSQQVEDYVCATSSYVTNMVQLGGVIEEWIVAKTNDENLLVANDTACFKVSKPIIELLEFKVRNNNTNAVADMTKFIYEENIYKLLSLKYDEVPNRGIAMYYRLGSNEILGGQYQLPQANTNEYTDYAIKKIIYSAFFGYSVHTPPNVQGPWLNILVKDYSFYVKYRTKDSVRQNHLRPDIRKYLLNSKHDRLPEYNQFNNQTDVLIDSIKFGNNVYGTLIKTGNSTYTISEWHDRYENVKHKGELYNIHGELYYVAKATHTHYGEYISSEITYSKDYNELSQVIGIPSEPRFYEISEQSSIKREFAINDTILMTDNPDQISYNGNFVFNYEHLSQLLFSAGTDFAKYAVTVFKGDMDSDKYSQTKGQSDLYIEVLNPINAYSSENTLTYEWDMIDNYSAGDQNVAVDNDENAKIDEQCYSSLKAVRYTDIYGKADLMDFYLLGNIQDFTADEIKALPESPISTKANDDTRQFIGNFDILATNVKTYDENFNGRGLGLLKDNREAISCNYNLQMITNSDTFVFSPFMYLPNKESVKVVLLANEVNKLSNGYIDVASIIKPYDTAGNAMPNTFDIQVDTSNTATNPYDNAQTIVTNFIVKLSSIFSGVNVSHFDGTEGYQQVKAIAVICNVALNPAGDTIASTTSGKSQFVFARNIPSDWDKTRATADIYFGGVDKDKLYTNKQ